MFRWCGALMACGLAVAAPTVGAQVPTRAFLDSVLAVPYDGLVSDLTASNDALHRALAFTPTSTLDQGRLYGRLTTVHHLLGQPDSATHYGLLAVDRYREAKAPALLGDAYCTLGHVLKRSDLPQALVYFRQGVALLEREGARKELSGSYDNFGAAHELDGALDSALFYYRRSLAIKEVMHDSIGIPYSLNKIAAALLPRQQFSEALALMQRADSIRVVRNDRMGLADQSAYFGDLYQAWGRYAEAIVRFREGAVRNSALHNALLVQYCQEHLSQCYEAIGDHRSALAAARVAVAIKDSVQGERNTRTVLELKERFNAAEKDRAIDLLNERAARRQLLLWSAAIVLVLVVVSGVLFYQVRSRRARTERDAAIIREREAGLKAVLEATEQERTRLARELHDGVGQRLGGIKHRLEHVRTSGTAELLPDAIALLDGTAHEVRELAHQLMPKALSRLGLVPALEELVRTAFVATPITAVFEAHGVPGTIRPELATGLYRITQELLNNVLKHAAATRVDVQLMHNKAHLVLIVHDDGRGFHSAQDRSGIGLNGMADRARVLGGSFAIESAPGNGTLATVRVPLEAPES